MLGRVASFGRRKMSGIANVALEGDAFGDILGRTKNATNIHYAIWALLPMVPIFSITVTTGWNPAKDYYDAEEMAHHHH